MKSWCLTEKLPDPAATGDFGPYVHDRTADRNARQQVFHQRNAARHREIQQRHGGYHAVKRGVLAAAQNRVQIEGIALKEIDAGDFALQMLEEIFRIFHRPEVFRLHAALQDGSGDRAGARAEFENGQAGSRIDHRGHGARAGLAGRRHRANRLGVVHPAAEKLQLIVELAEEFPDSRQQGHSRVSTLSRHNHGAGSRPT